jgi:chaperonin GroEL
VQLAFAERRLGCGLLVTTEAMVAEKPERKTPPAMPPGGGMGGMGGMDDF